MSLKTTAADVAQFLTRLLPAAIPVYQAPTAADPITGAMIQGIKFHGVVPTRDPKQPADMQPRSIVSLPDSRIEPVTSNRTGAKVFRFTGVSDDEQYIFYLNMLPGQNASWAMTLFFNLDSVSSSGGRRTLMQTVGTDITSGAGTGEIDIGINKDGKVEVVVMGRNDLTQYVQLTHNSGYLAVSYNSARTELSIQINNTVLPVFGNTKLQATNTVLPVFDNTKLQATSVIFGLSYERSEPFGPGYLGAITLHPNQYYTLLQLSRLAQYVPLPEPPKSEEPPQPVDEEKGKEEGEQTTSGETQPAEQTATVPVPVPPEVPEDIELEPVMQPPVVITDPVTGEKTVIPTPPTANQRQQQQGQQQNQQSIGIGGVVEGEPVPIPRFRHYNFQVPILQPSEPVAAVETFIATRASGVSHAATAHQIDPTASNHRRYHPNQ